MTDGSNNTTDQVVKVSCSQGARMGHQSHLRRHSHVRPPPPARYILRFQLSRVDAKRERLGRSAKKSVRRLRHQYYSILLTRLILILLVLLIATRTESCSCYASKLWNDFPASQPDSSSDERSVPDDDVVTYHYILSDDTALENAVSSDCDIVEEVRVDDGGLRADMRSASDS